MRCTLLLFNMTNNWGKLSRAWAKDLIPPDASFDGDYLSIQRAIQRTLPLLNDDPTVVPFICRYRTDVIDPLNPRQVMQLSEYTQKYNSLSSLRKKILEHLDPSKGDHSSAIDRVETSISKSELDDIYAPFRPPSKGSLEDRILKEHPDLVARVDDLWSNWGTDHADNKLLRKLKPWDKAATLLANRIAADVGVMDALMDYCKQACRLKIKQANGGKEKKGTRGKSSAFETYYDYSNRVCNLQDHQVLAIRRGIGSKKLAMRFEIDDERADHIIRTTAFDKKQSHQLYQDARKDAWSRLLKKRCTSRLWKEASNKAEERSIHVFSENLRSALLAPPATMNGQKALLALDPGFQAGIKCAILCDRGRVISLDTVKFLGSLKSAGEEKLISMLREVKDKSGRGNIQVVLGNGHGTREARQLLQEAALKEELEIDIHLISEAGASVWSVTEMAQEEFPTEAPAAIASVSLGRRWLNPLNELVKIPPKSLGLGMYQHDLSEKLLDEKLNLASVDAVASVGVDVNSCSLEILSKVPSLTGKLCNRIVKARPLQSRNDLLNISGLGPKTYQNSAAFVRVTGGDEQLDATLVHPESYDLAKWMMKKLHWKLSDASCAKMKPDNEGTEKWKAVATRASSKFGVPQERALSVIDNLYQSITCPDPRLRKQPKNENTLTAGSASDCSSLPSHLSTIEKLQKSDLPLRGIVATVRNVVDFGAFVDIGLENDGLLHRTKLGNVPLTSLMVGQDIGIDVLGISKNRISVGLNGLNLPGERLRAKRQTKAEQKNPPGKKRRVN